MLIEVSIGTAAADPTGTEQHWSDLVHLDSWVPSDKSSQVATSEAPASLTT